MRVLVVAPSTMAQAGMAGMVEGIEGLLVAAAVAPGGAVAAGRASEPDICLVDTEGAGLGDGTIADLVDGLGCPVVVVCEETAIGPALAAGARGAVGPAIGPMALAAALAAAAAGVEVVYPPTGAPGRRLPARAGSAPGLLEALTPRELEVLALLPAGLTNQQVALRLGITEHTAKFHVSAVLGKLGAQSRAEAVNRAYQLGLVSI